MTESAQVTQVDSRKRIAGDEVWEMAAAEYGRMLDVLRTLGDGDWTRPTECTAWDVRAMLGHLVGAAEGFSKPSEMVHQYRLGAQLLKRGEADGHSPVDGANAVQVRERAGATTAELIARYEDVIPKVLRWRRRLRWIPVSMQDDGGRFSFRELYEVILTRDTWMHRVDIARATGRDMVLTPDHDGRIVEDLVVEWAKKHRRPFSLVLDGPAGGRFDAGIGEPHIAADAIEFARALSGRRGQTEILGTRVVF